MNVILFVTAITLILFYTFLNNYKKALYLSFFLFILLSHLISIDVGGSLPKLTIHRIMLLIITIFWLIKDKPIHEIPKLPFIGWLLLIALENYISLWNSVDFNFSLKIYFSFTFETILFYIIISTSIDKDRDVIKVLNYIALSLTVVGLIAMIEKFTGYNPIDPLLPQSSRVERIRNDIISTYPQRILMGTAVAMGWPIVLSLINYYKKDQIKRNFWFIAIIILLSACYFSNSRGPWVAAILAGLLMFIIGTSRLKYKLIFIILLIFIALAFNPGVRETLIGKATATFADDSFKGSTYQYRWELWRVAYEQVSASFFKTLFGFGPGAHETMDIHGTLSFSDREHTFWSWDNHYACIILETGFLGIVFIALLYYAIMRRLFKIWLKLEKQYKDIMLGIMTSITIMLFMMSNVKIFAPQLNFLFWILVVLGLKLEPDEEITNID